MVSKYAVLFLLWTLGHILKLIVQGYKSLTKSEKWLINNPSVPFNSDGLFRIFTKLGIRNP